MKKLLLAVVALFVATSTVWAQSPTIPSVKIQSQSGAAVDSSTWVDGKTPFILSFWSTTCKPCIKELDTLNEYYADWSEEKPFRIIAVSIDDSRSVARAKALATGRGWSDSASLYYDVNSNFKRAMNVVSVPQVFIFDKNGKQVYAHTGYTPGNEYELFEKIKTLD